MGDEILHVGPHGEVVQAPFENGPTCRLLELELNLAHEGEALGLVQLLGLLLDELGDGLVAVVRVVPVTISSLSGEPGVKPASPRSLRAVAFSSAAGPYPGMTRRSASSIPHTPYGRGTMEAPRVEPPW